MFQIKEPSPSLELGSLIFYEAGAISTYLNSNLLKELYIKFLISFL
jgi:hypothetical protein